MRNIFYLLPVILLSKISAYVVEGPLLFHLDLINEKSQKFSVKLFNNENKTIKLHPEVGYLQQDQQGNLSLNSQNSSFIPLKLLTPITPLAPGEKKILEYEVLISDKEKLPECVCMGILISQDREQIENQKTEKQQTGLKVYQNYLVQVYAKTKRSPSGQIAISSEKLTHKLVEFLLKNESNNVAELEALVFMTKDKTPVTEPIKKKFRVLPQSSRLCKIELEQEGINKVQLFIDNPNFNFIDKEIVLK